MTIDEVAALLLIPMLALSLALGGLACATLGRKLLDIEYQQVAKVNGVRLIQSWINVRNHTGRISVGFVLLVVTGMALVEIDTALRVLLTRALWVALLLMFVVSTVIDWRDERRQLRILHAEEGHS